MKRSPWPSEQAVEVRNAPELPGLPVRSLVWSLLLHGLVLAFMSPVFVVPELPVAPAASLKVEFRPPAPAVAPVVDESPLWVKRASAVLITPRPVRAAVQSVAAPASVSPAPTFAAADVPAADVPNVPATSGLVPQVYGKIVAGADPTPSLVMSVAPTGAETAVGGPDAAGLRQFRLALASEARRFRRYPAAARHAGLSGTVEVQIVVAAVGQRRHADLSRSSGHALLDAAAVDMLQQAAAQVVLPESLRGQSFAVLLPVVFEVDE